MLATAVLGFMPKGNIDKLQTTLKETKGQIAQARKLQAKTAKTDADKAQKDAKDAAEKADAAEQRRRPRPRKQPTRRRTQRKKTHLSKARRHEDYRPSEADLTTRRCKPPAANGAYPHRRASDAG